MAFFFANWVEKATTGLLHCGVLRFSLPVLVPQTLRVDEASRYDGKEAKHHPRNDGGEIAEDEPLPLHGDAPR